MDNSCFFYPKIYFNLELLLMKCDDWGLISDMNKN